MSDLNTSFIMPDGVVKEKASEDGKYARFTAEPFESGYAQTVGNSLRRVLLSSIEGVAITAIRKWRKADPEIYGIEIACMVRRDGKWRLITNFEDFRDRINKLDNDTLNVFNKLEQYYWDYKREHVEIVRKRKNERFR